MPVLAVFGWLDWGVVGIYFALVITVGFVVARKEQDTGEYFLGGRSLPTWAVAVSLVATMLSTATFVGVPDGAFVGDISYLSLNLGGVIAVFVVAALFIPRLYRAGTVTIYGFLARRYGEPARLAVSCTFIFGRMLASGARLFVAALPLVLLLFGAGEHHLWQLIMAIGLIGVVGTFYATVGGIRAVVWVDTIQFAIVMGTALLSVAILLHRIPLSIPQIVNALGHAPADPRLAPPPVSPSKLHLVDLSLDFARPYTLWSALLAATFFNVAAFGVDHDLAQRFLISKSSFRGGISVIASQFIGMLVVSLFLAIGLLLYIFYQRPDIMGVAHQATADRTTVYPWFLQSELPTGLAGLAIAGFFAIAQGSLDSAMNALASSIVADVYLPLRRLLRPGSPVPTSAKASRRTVAAVGGALICFAIICAMIYDPKAKTLLDFVLGVMIFGYSGMLGVFIAALFTRRGNSASVIAALLISAAIVTLLQDTIMAWWTTHLYGSPLKLAWPWWMPIGTTTSFLVCIAGRPKRAVRA